MVTCINNDFLKAWMDFKQPILYYILYILTIHHKNWMLNRARMFDIFAFDKVEMTALYSDEKSYQNFFHVPTEI